MKSYGTLLAAALFAAGCGGGTGHAASADTASKADEATTAETAQNASHAKTADNATSAVHANTASQADEASELEGKHASDFETAADAATKVSALTVNAPLVNSGDAQHPTLSLPAASADKDGYLAATAYQTFAAKQEALQVTGPLTLDPTSATLGVRTASALSDGALSQTDWVTFSGKQNAITAAAPLALDQVGNLHINAASATTDGALTHTDWAAFSTKQNAIHASAPLTLDGNGNLTVAAAGHGVASGVLSGTDWDTFNNKANKTGEAGYIQNGPSTAQTASISINGTIATTGTPGFKGDGSGLTGVALLNPSGAQTGGLNLTGNVTTSGKFQGDGSLLTGVMPGTAYSGSWCNVVGGCAGTPFANYRPAIIPIPNGDTLGTNDAITFLVSGQVSNSNVTASYLFTYLVTVVGNGTGYYVTAQQAIPINGMSAPSVTRSSATTLLVETSPAGGKKSVRVIQISP